MRSNTRERRLSTSALYVLFISNKYGIICSNLKDQSFEKWNSLGKRSVVENCKFWARMRATRLQCTPRKCSRMHAPTTLLFASLLPNAWQNEVNSGAVCASVWKISTVTRIMTADRSVNTVHRDEFCFSWKSAGSWIFFFRIVAFEGLITIKFDTWREEEKKKRQDRKFKGKSEKKYLQIWIRWYARKKKKLRKYYFEIVLAGMHKEKKKAIYFYWGSL